MKPKRNPYNLKPLSRIVLLAFLATTALTDIDDEGNCPLTEMQCGTATITNCVQCASPASKNQCDICITGSSPSTQNKAQCVYCREGCRDCGTDNESCERCFRGYYMDTLQNGKKGCFACEPNCQHCAKSVCLTCKTGYYRESGGPLCLKCPGVCVTCAVSNKCETCSTGYYSDAASTNGCSRCSVTNCYICKNGTSCDQCVAGYYLKDSATCEKNPDLPPNARLLL